MTGLLIYGSGFSQLFAQCAAKNEAFQSGEVVEYDLHFNWKFIWTKAGYATLKTTSTTYEGKKWYKMDLLAVGSKKADFFFKMRDTISSVVSEKLEPIYFRKGAEEGKRYTVDEAFFSYTNGVSHVHQVRLRHTGEIVEADDSDSRCIHDMLSILAQARSFDPTSYEEGHRITFPMATGHKVEEQILIFRGRKNFTGDNKMTYRCLVFSLVEMKGGKEKEVITFYITDDKNHLPVRLDLFLNFGSAKAFLKDVSGNRHPLTSIIE
ncbi:MAG: DUF3108 domain-containing protein, partial [Bacteroides sp.]|nr:DUF3108 domain-containing protein [Bacteroides sp.]